MKTQNKKLFLVGIILSSFLIGMFWHPPDNQAAQVKRIQPSTFTVTSSQGANTGSLGNAVTDSSKTFLFNSFKYTSGGNWGDHSMCFIPNLDEAATVSAQRGDTGCDVDVTVYAAEFNDGIKIQQGTTVMVGTTYSKSITLSQSVDPTKAFVILHNYGNFNWTWGANTSGLYATATISADGKTLTIDRKSNAGNTVSCMFYYEVIEFLTDCRVQSGTAQIPAAGSTVDVTLSGSYSPIIATDHAFLVLQFATNASGANPPITYNAGDDRLLFVRGNIVDANTLRFYRNSTGAANQSVWVSWYLVELRDPSSLVQKNVAGTPLAINVNGNTTANLTTNPIDITRAMPIFGVSMAADAGLQYVPARCTLSTTQILFNRAYTTNIPSADWFAIEFSPLKLTAPDGAEIGANAWKVGDQKYITWKHADSLTTGGTFGGGPKHKVTLSISVDGGLTYNTLENEDDSDGIGETQAVGLDGTLDSYTWTIPASLSGGTNLVGKTLKVKITDTDMTARNYDESNAVFEIKGKISVATPAGTPWIVGDTGKSIKWTPSGNLSSAGLGTVKIELSMDGGSTWDLLADNVTAGNHGAEQTYSWNVPSALNGKNPIGEDNIIKVTHNALIDPVSIDYSLDGTPIKIVTTAAHGLSTGDRVIIAGHCKSNGTTFTYINNSGNPWTITKVDNTSFTLDTSVAQSAGSGKNGSVTKTVVITASAASPVTPLIRITTASAHGFGTGDQVNISGHSVAGVNNDWIITNIDATHFDLQNSTFASAGANGNAKKHLSDTNVSGQSPQFHINGAISNIRVTDMSDNLINLATTPILIGTNYKVKWDKKGHFGTGITEGTVRISYSDNTGATYSKELILATDSGTEGGGGSWTWDTAATNMSKTPDTYFSKLKVEQSGDAVVSDVSANFLVREGTLTLNALAKSSYAFGEAVNISWTASPNLISPMSTIEIALSRNSGGTYDTILATKNADQSLSWNAELPVNDNACQIRIKSNKFPGLAPESALFSITGQMQVSAPAAHAIWEIGATKDIDWNPANFETVDIYVSRNNGGSWGLPIVSGRTASNHPYSWPVLAPGSLADEAIVKIVGSYKGQTIVGTSSGFTIRETIHVDAPNTANLIWRVGSTPTVSWTIQGSLPGNKVDIFYRKGAAGAEIQLTQDGGVTADSGGGTGSWTWSPYRTSPNVPDDIYYNDTYVIVKDSGRSYIKDTTDDDKTFKIKGAIEVATIGGSGAVKYIKCGDQANIGFTVKGSVGSSGSPKTVKLWLSKNGGSGYGASPIATTQVTGAGTYSVAWTPLAADQDPIGGNRVIKVAVDGEEDLVTGTAGISNVFYVKPKLTLTYPNQETPKLSFNMGNDLVIRWTPVPAGVSWGGNLAIKYDKGAGTFVGTVVSSVDPNNMEGGSVGYKWPLTSGDACGGDIKLRLYLNVSGEEDIVKTESDFSFAILGSIVLKNAAKTGGVTWTMDPSESHLIEWTPTGSIGNINIFYSTSGAPYIKYVAKDVNSALGQYNWNILYGTIDPDFPGRVDFEKNANVTFKVITTDGSNISDMSTGPLTIKSKIVFSQPTGFDTILKVYAPGDTKPTIRWDTYKAGSVPKINLRYDTSGGSGGWGGIIASAEDNLESYPGWEVPATSIGKNVKVKVYSTNFNDIADQSAASFRVKGQIKVSSPNSGIVGANAWPVNRDVVLPSLKNIVWTNYGNLLAGTVSILYSSIGDFDHPANYSVLSSTESGADGQHSYEWKVANNPVTTNRIKIIDNDVDSDTSAEPAVSDPFEIMGKLQILGPKNGEECYAGIETDIRWKYAGNVGLVDLEYYETVEAQWKPINTEGVQYNNAEQDNICYYPWTPTKTGYYRFRITSRNNALVKDEIPAGQECIVLGSITLNSPGKNAGNPEKWVVDGLNNSISYTVNGVTKVDIHLNINGAGPSDFAKWADPAETFEIILDHTPVTTPTDTYTWSIPVGKYVDVTSDKCRIRVKDHGISTILGASTNNFSIKPKVTLDALTGLPWKVKDNATISWTYKGNIGTLHIYYSNNNGAGGSWSLIKTVAANALSTLWNIDPTGYEKVTNNEGLIKLVRYDGSPAAEDTDVTSTSPSFTIRGLIDNVVVVPTNLNVQSTGTITWDKYGLVGNVLVQYNKNYPSYPIGDYTTVPNFPAAGIASNYGPYVFDVPNTTSPKVLFRVVEKDKQEVYGVSGEGSIKGNIIFNKGTTEDKNFTVGTQYTVSWTNVGVSDVKFFIKKGSGNFQQVGGVISGDSTLWTPGDDDISDSVIFRVEDALDSNVGAQTASGHENKIKGSLSLTYPNGSAISLVVGDPASVKWIKQGSIGTLKIEFSLDGTNWYTTAAGLYDAYDSGTSGVEQTAPWTVPDRISKNTCQVRITSSLYPSLTDTTADIKKFTIRGKLNSISSPVGGTWYVGETNRTIGWNATGKMRAVKIELSTDGSTYLPTPIVAEYTSLQNGANTYPWSAVADVKSDTCKIKISDVDNPGAANSEIPSGSFTIMPKIVVSTPGADWTAETKPTVSWQPIAGTQTTQVDVLLNSNGGSGQWFALTPPAGVAKGSSPYTVANAVPADYITDLAIIRVRDHDTTVQSFLFGDCASTFHIRGEINLVGSLSDTTVGTNNFQLSWDYKGNMGTLNIYADYGSGYEVVPVGTPAYNASPWTWAPAVPDHIAPVVKLKILDADKTDTVKESNNFAIKGSLELIAPTDSSNLTVGGSSSIQWRKYGSIGTLKMELSLDKVTWLTAAQANFPPNGDVDPGSDGVVMSQPWTVPDQTSKQCVVRLSCPTYPALTKVSGTNGFTIKGAFLSFTYPDASVETWYVNEAKNIVWNTNGKMRRVKIELSVDGTNYLPTPIAAEYTTLQDGQNTYPWSQVTDQKSDQCKIRITDLDNLATTPLVSPRFIIKPKIQAAVQNPPLIAGSKPTVTWQAIAGTKTTAVDIMLALDGIHFTTTLDSNVSKDGSPRVTANALPADLADNAVIRVQDHDTLAKDYVYGDTVPFAITGTISITNITDCKVAENNKTIQWSKEGNIGNVNIWVDYNGDGTPDEELQHDKSGTSWDWPLIPDEVCTNAKIKIESHDRPAISKVSNSFCILGILAFKSMVPVVQIDKDNTQFMDVKWTTKGNNVKTSGQGITKVKLEYSPTGLSGDYVVIDANLNNQFKDGTTVNTWEWNNSRAVPIPKDVASDVVKFRISASTPSQPTTAVESGTFYICGDVYVKTPNGSEIGGQSWVADGTTSHTLEWQIAGKVDTVKISYSNDDGLSYPPANVITASTNAHNVSPTLGSLPWTIPAEITKDFVSIAKQKSRITIEDTDSRFNTYARDESAQFTVKGTLAFTAGTLSTLAAGLTAGAAPSISWDRTAGKILAVDVYYSRNNGGSFPNLIQSGVAFTSGVATKTITWNVPEYVGTSADSNGYALKVFDSNNDETIATTPTFQVKGQLEYSGPNSGEFIMGAGNMTITWNVTHGNIAQVKIIGSRSGNFDDQGVPGSDIFLIKDSTQADNVPGWSFNPATTPKAKGSFDWTMLPDKTPTILGSTVKVKVLDANTNYSVSSLATPNPLIIKGAITVTTPAVEWKVGDIDKTIDWTTTGNIPFVHIQFLDGKGGVINVTNPATGTPGSNHPFSVANWYSYNKVPDAKSTGCKIRITDLSNPDVTKDSGSFTVYPVISNVVVVPNTDDQGKSPVIWRAGLSNQKVTWNDVSPNVSSVNIYYYSPTKNPFPGSKLKTADSLANGANSCDTITVPLGLASDAIVRVMDDDPFFDAKVYADSTEFRILGRIAIGTIEQNWFVGDVDRQVSWTGYGNEMSQVEILIDYGDGNNFQSVKTLLVGASPWTFDDPDGGILGVGDHVSENVRVKIRDNDSGRKADTEYISNTFNIAGKFSNFVITPVSGDTKVVAGKPGAKISWTRTGTAIAQVILEFSKANGAPGSWGVLDDGIPPAGTVSANQEYTWTPASTDIADNLCLVRVTDPDNSAATKTSNTFTVTSKVKVDKPDINSKWEANKGYDIEWTKWGTFTNVKIYYRPNNTIAWQDAPEIDPAVVKPSNNVDASHGKYRWNIAPETALSTTAEVRVVDADNASFSIPGDSALFTTKGSLEVLLPDGTGTYITGMPITLKWKRYGTIAGVNVYYSTNNGSTFNPITDLQGIDFVGQLTEKQVNWSPPEQVGTQASGNGYVIQIKDKDNPNDTQAISGIFTVKGKIQITNPDDQQPTFAIGTGGTITWNIEHGNIQNVKIIGSRSGNFNDQGSPGSDMFVIVPSTDADNAAGFNPANSPVAQGSYSWSFPEQTPSILSNAAKIKILDANTNYSVESVSSSPFYIKGKFEITQKPSTTDLAYIDKPYNSLQWKTYGAISTVKVQFKTEFDADWVDIAQIANNPGTPGGPATTSYAWTPDDAKIDVCQQARIRILQVGDPQGNNVNQPSEEFPITGWFEFKVTDAPADANLVWDVGTVHRIIWTNHGVVTPVKIEYSPDIPTDHTFYPIRSSEANVGYYDWTPAAATTYLSPNAIIRVSDPAVGRESNNAVSLPFHLAGKINLLGPLGGQEYKIGVIPSPNITWEVTGKITNVRLDYSINGGGNFNNPIIDSTSASVGSFPWSIIDPPSANVVVRVSDVNDIKAKATSNPANPIRIQATFAISSPQKDGGGNPPIWTVDEYEDISWVTTKGTCRYVNIDYTSAAVPNEGDWVNYKTKYDNNGEGILNTLQWKVANIISKTCKIRISDWADSHAQKVSDDFEVIGHLHVITPDGGVDLNVGSLYDITWQKTGSIDSVKLEYSVDGSTYPPTLPNNPIAEGINLNDSDCSDHICCTGSTCTYRWNPIPDALSTKVRVKVTNEANPFVCDDSYDFNTIRAVLNITSFDVNPEILRVGDPKDIIWTRKGTVGTVKLEYSTNGFGADGKDESQVFTIEESVNSTGVDKGGGLYECTYPWTIPAGALGGNIKVRVKTTDAVNKPALANISPKFIVKGKIDLQAPVSGEKLTVDDSYDITWYTRGNLNGLTPAGLTLRLSVDGGGTYLPTAITTNATPGNDNTTNTHHWTVPNQIYTNLVVILAELNADSMVTDLAGPFTIRAGIKVLFPNGPTDYIIHQKANQYITWEKHGTLGNVDIKLDDAGGLNLYTIPIASDVPSTNYLWSNLVPNTLVGDDFKIKISDHAAGTQTLSDTSDASFKIRGSIAFDPASMPAKNEVWMIGSSKIIKWTTIGPITTVILEYSKGGGIYSCVTDVNGNPVPEIVLSGAQPYTFSWKIPQAAKSTTCKLRIREKRLDGDGNPIIDVYNIQPTGSDTFIMRGGFIWKTPDANTTFELMQNVGLSWDSFGGINPVNLEYSPNMRADWFAVSSTVAINNDGDEPWYLDPAKVPVANPCIIRLQDPADPNAQAELNIKIKGKLTFVTPNINTTWKAGEKNIISWNKIGDIGLVSIDYEKEGGGGGSISPEVQADQGGGAGTCEWNTPAAAVGSTRVVIKQKSDPTIQWPSAYFPVKANFVFSTPNVDTTWFVDDPANITWTTYGSVGHVKLSYWSKNNAWVEIVPSFDNNGPGLPTTYPWPKVADNIANNVKILIEDTGGSGTVAESAPFKIRGSITITKPANNPDGSKAVLKIGRNFTIEWTEKGHAENVEIWFDGGLGFGQIPGPGVTIPNTTRSYPWPAVIDVLLPCEEARFRIKTVGYDIEDYSDTFIVVPDFNIVNPFPNEVFEVNKNPANAIKWTCTSANLGFVHLDYSINGVGGPFNPVTIEEVGNPQIIGQQGQYPWLLNSFSNCSSNAYVRITGAVNGATVQGQVTSSKFYIRPIFNLQNPNGNEKFVIGKPNDIKWTCQGNLAQVKVIFSALGDFSDAQNLPAVPPIADGLVANAVGANTFPWTIPDGIFTDTAKIRITSPDEINGVDQSEAGFKIVAGFTIDSPLETQEYKVGGNVPIWWKSTSSGGPGGNVPKVDFAYSTNNGGDYTTFDYDINNPVVIGTQGQYTWENIGENLITKVAKIKVIDSGDADGFEESKAFVIKADLDFVQPGGSADQTLTVGDALELQWKCKGNVATVKFQYSFDAANPNSWVDLPGAESVANPAADGQGIRRFTVSTGVPDIIGKEVWFRVADNVSGHPASYAVSDNKFRVKGVVAITAPRNAVAPPPESNKVAMEIGLSYDITWTMKGSIPNVIIDYCDDNGNFGVGHVFPIATIATVGYLQGDGSYKYPWTPIPDNANGTSFIRIRDSRNEDFADVVSISDIFRIRGYIRIDWPNGDEQWKVKDNTKSIKWTWGGTLDEVEISLSKNGKDGDYNPIPVNSIIDTSAYHGGGTYTLPWEVPDAISNDVWIKVTYTRDPGVYDVSDKKFKIYGGLELTAPVNNDRWVTREDHTITWNTAGTIPKVKLEYLKYNADGSLRVIRDIDGNIIDDGIELIAAEVPNTGADLGKYAWSIPDDRWQYVKVRVSDTRDPDNVFSLYPNGYFKIDYYTVSFEIRDMMTNKRLPLLTAKGANNKGDKWETSYQPGSNNTIYLGSPVTVDLPAGAWAILWSKTAYSEVQNTFDLFSDRIVDDPPESHPEKTWNLEGQGNLHMETSAIHIWRAYADFSYKPAVTEQGVTTPDSLAISCWLERDGFMISGGQTVKVSIYDGDTPLKDKSGNNMVLNAPGSIYAVGTNPDEAGFFHLLWTDTTLEVGKVYTVVTDITNAALSHFKTPTSFSITESKKLQDVQDTVNWALDRPITQVEEKITQMIAGANITSQDLIGLGGMKGVVEKQLNDQTELIVGPDRTKADIMAAGGMVGMLQSSLNAFETNATLAINDLQSGANKAVLAGEELRATAKKYSWKASASPDPALSGDRISIQLQGQPDLLPMLAIYSWDNKPLVSDAIMTETRPGFYVYEFNADVARFTPGKAYTYLITEQVTQGLVSGSGMVESMSISTVAGLAAAAPEAERAAKKALEAIKAVEAVLVSNENINIALTLKSLKESVEELPDILNREGPNAQLIGAINDISERIKTFVGKEGVDLGTLLDEKLGDASTLKDVRNKTDTINAIVDMLLQIMEGKFGGVDSPIISTSMQSGSVKFRIMAVNPSRTRIQKIQVKKYLPEEVKPKDVMEMGDLELEFDAERSIYYVYRNDVELKPGEARVFEVEVEDIWMIPQGELTALKGQVGELMAKFEKSPYLAKAKEITEPIYPLLDEMAKSQSDDSVSRERHIGIYRQNTQNIKAIQERLVELEKMLEPPKGVKTPDLLEKKLKINLPSKTTTWLIIMIVIAFLGLLAGIFFFVWQGQIRSSQNTINEARKSSFPGKNAQGGGEPPAEKK